LSEGDLSLDFVVSWCENWELNNGKSVRGRDNLKTARAGSHDLGSRRDEDRSLWLLGTLNGMLNETSNKVEELLFRKESTLVAIDDHVISGRVKLESNNVAVARENRVYSNARSKGRRVVQLKIERLVDEVRVGSGKKNERGIVGHTLLVHVSNLELGKSWTNPSEKAVGKRTANLLVFRVEDVINEMDHVRLAVAIVKLLRLRRTVHASVIVKGSRNVTLRQQVGVEARSKLLRHIVGLTRARSRAQVYPHRNGSLADETSGVVDLGFALRKGRKQTVDDGGPARGKTPNGWTILGEKVGEPFLFGRNSNGNISPNFDLRRSEHGEFIQGLGNSLVVRHDLRLKDSGRVRDTIGPGPATHDKRRGVFAEPGQGRGSSTKTREVDLTKGASEHEGQDWTKPLKGLSKRSGIGDFREKDSIQVLGHKRSSFVKVSDENRRHPEGKARNNDAQSLERRKHRGIGVTKGALDRSSKTNKSVQNALESGGDSSGELSHSIRRAGDAAKRGNTRLQKFLDDGGNALAQAHNGMSRNGNEQGKHSVKNDRNHFDLFDRKVVEREVKSDTIEPTGAGGRGNVNKEFGDNKTPFLGVKPVSGYLVEPSPLPLGNGIENGDKTTLELLVVRYDNRTTKFVDSRRKARTKNANAGNKIAPSGLRNGPAYRREGRTEKHRPKRLGGKARGDRKRGGRGGFRDQARGNGRGRLKERVANYDVGTVVRNVVDIFLKVVKNGL